MTLILRLHTRARIRTVAALLAALVALAGCDAPPPPGFGLALHGEPSPEAIDNAYKTLGWPITLVVFFVHWPGDRQPEFPDEGIRAIRDAGAVPVITWEPMTVEAGKETAVAASEILDGHWNDYIDAFAVSARKSGGRIILRFAHEMNLSRYHWGGGRSEYGPESPGRYRAMFRHIRDRFRLHGADNVLFAFCPNAESLPHPVRDGADWNTASAYYPGDDAVDVLGMDGYNWGTTFTVQEHGWDSRFTSFAEIFSPLHEELRAPAPHKPVVVFETASVAQGGDKTTWIKDAVHASRRWGLAGLCWFNADKEHDWRLESGITPAKLRPLAGMVAPRSDALALPVGKERP
ncbi:glycoside hydrolase family 26 protein [Pseudodesulfovibrio aespoeensis]|uniref:glycoside hydrolase family 26 protein n=1 Tax=Pseudodesulfovibrio aespoeensis TaxID=182210 RepID=UPI0023555507|nr:glycosyl hydrolase [Pseudodesulfovibrio aespoeensis]MCG2733089.1 glycoside hydrolase family 26 protein [Pseudodesulfovibrio aespoeensis]